MKLRIWVHQFQEWMLIIFKAIGCLFLFPDNEFRSNCSLLGLQYSHWNLGVRFKFGMLKNLIHFDIFDIDLTQATNLYLLSCYQRISLILTLTYFSNYWTPLPQTSWQALFPLFHESYKVLNTKASFSQKLWKKGIYSCSWTPFCR